MIYKNKKSGFMIDSDKKIESLETSKNWEVIETIEIKRTKKAKQTKKK